MIEDRCTSCGSLMAGPDDDEPDFHLVIACSECLACTDCCGHDEERPERLRSDAAARREWSRLRKAVGRAASRGDRRAVDYLTGRLQRLDDAMRQP